MNSKNNLNNPSPNDSSFFLMSMNPHPNIKCLVGYTVKVAVKYTTLRS